MALFCPDSAAPPRLCPAAVRLGALAGGIALLLACAPASTSTNMPSDVNPSPASVAARAGEPSRELPAYQWELSAARDAHGQADARWHTRERPPLRLAFKDGRVAVHNLCNVISADYRLDGDQLRIGHATSTMRACAEPGLMALEQRVTQQLSTAQSLEVRRGMQAGSAPQLTLRFADGSEWDLNGKPTAQTRYGSAGERMFLEVAAHKVDCNRPQMRHAMCLRVRELTYGDNGVKTKVGEWRIFEGVIEGYEHRPGVRNIVRVKRYDLARKGQLPADSPEHAYVLDMVIESETVR